MKLNDQIQEQRRFKLTETYRHCSNITPNGMMYIMNVQ